MEANAAGGNEALPPPLGFERTPSGAIVPSKTSKSALTGKYYPPARTASLPGIQPQSSSGIMDWIRETDRLANEDEMGTLPIPKAAGTSVARAAVPGAPAAAKAGPVSANAQAPTLPGKAPWEFAQTATEEGKETYGGFPKSNLSVEQALAIIEQNKTLPEGMVFAGYTRDAKGNVKPQFINTKSTRGNVYGLQPGTYDAKGKPIAGMEFDTYDPNTLPAPRLPQLDLSRGMGGAVDFMNQTIPFAYAAGQRKNQERAQKLFMDKYGVDLKRYELAMQAPKLAAETSFAQAGAKKYEAEAAAAGGRGTVAGGKLSLEQTKQLTEMYQMNPDAFDAIAGIDNESEDERTKLRPAKLREMLGFSGTAEAGGKTALTPQQAAAIRQRVKEERAKGTSWDTIAAELSSKGIDPNKYGR